MTRPRIALLNAADDDGDTRRNFRREVDADLVEYDVRDSQLPERLDVDGCIVTGSRASVYWDEPWIEELKVAVRGAIDRDLPVLGVCFGHQLLADVLGGTVEPMGEYEIGYRTVRHDGSSRLLAGVDEAFTVFTTHSDRVVDLPPGAEQFAANEYGVHGFRKDRVFGVQFHPEYDPATAESVTRGKDLPDERIARVCEGIDDETYAAACEAKRLFENYTDFVRSVAEGEDGTATASADD